MQSVLDVDGTAIVWSGVNVYIDSGSGATDTRVAGFGNLFVGHNEQADEDNKLNGSHALVLGLDNDFRGTGAFASGESSGASSASQACSSIPDPSFIRRSVTTASMRMPASSARSCSRRSRVSSTAGGKATNRASAARRKATSSLSSGGSGWAPSKSSWAMSRLPISW